MTKQTKIIISVVLSCTMLLLLFIPSFASSEEYGIAYSIPEALQVVLNPPDVTSAYEFTIPTELKTGDSSEFYYPCNITLTVNSTSYSISYFQLVRAPILNSSDYIVSLSLVSSSDGFTIFSNRYSSSGTFVSSSHLTSAYRLQFNSTFTFDERLYTCFAPPIFESNFTTNISTLTTYKLTGNYTAIAQPSTETLVLMGLFGFTIPVDVVYFGEVYSNIFVSVDQSTSQAFVFADDLLLATYTVDAETETVSLVSSLTDFSVSGIITSDDLQLFNSLFTEVDVPTNGNPFLVIMNSVIDALDVPIFGTFSLWDMLTTICGLFAVIWLLKLLAGG